MNIFFWADVLSLVFLMVVTVFFVSFKSFEENKFHPIINSLLFGLFFLMVYFLLGVVASLMSAYGLGVSAVNYSAYLVVLPLAAIFFLVSTILRPE